MTATTEAQKLVWVNECDHTQCADKPSFTGVKYVRFDAPELVALVAALQEIADKPTLHSDGCELDWLIDEAKEAIDAFTALIAKDTAND